MAKAGKASQARKVPVSERSVVQRVQRKLHHRELILKANRSTRWPELGRWYLINFRDGIEALDIDLTALAREEGVLKDWEEVAE